jgi:hypothetical protein
MGYPSKMRLGVAGPAMCRNGRVPCKPLVRAGPAAKSSMTTGNFRGKPSRPEPTILSTRTLRLMSSRVRCETHAGGMHGGSMTTAAALTYRAIVRMLKDVAVAWSRQNRSTGPMLSGLCTLTGEELHRFDEQLGCRGWRIAPPPRQSSQILKNVKVAEPADAPCVVPFAPVPSRCGARDKKSASVLP